MTINKQFTFSPNTTADPSQVNTNFDDLYAWANTEAIQRDGSIPFTAYPTLPGTDPQSSTDAAPRGYVDAVTPKLKGGLFTGSTASDGTVVITHGLGAVPTSATANVNTATGSTTGRSWNIVVDGGNINTVTFRVCNSAGTAVASTAVRLNWMAFAPPA